MYAIYVTFIADGHADAESPAPYYPGDMSEEGSDYWYSLRNAELDCPTCAGEGYQEHDDGHREECDTCEGSGHVYGEPFEVVRYIFDTEEEADAAYRAIEDTGDGYERAAVLAHYAGVTVLEWTPYYL